MPTINQARAWYPADDPVHGFDHILRVYRLAEQIAQTESADIEIVRAAALLHDVNPAAGEHRRGEHQRVSAEFAAEILTGEGWPVQRIAAVQHAIRAHRYRDVSEPPATLEACVVFDADKLDAIGLIGAARAIAYAARHGLPAYSPVSTTFITEGRPEAGEVYSAYHEFCFKLRHIKDRLHTASGRRLAETRHAQMTAFFEGLAREGQHLSIS